MTVGVAAPVFTVPYSSEAAPAKPKVTKPLVLLPANATVSPVVTTETVWYWSGKDRTMVDRTPVGADPLPGTFNGVVNNTRTVAENSQLGAEMREKERNDAELLRLSPPGTTIEQARAEIEAFEKGRDSGYAEARKSESRSGSGDAERRESESRIKKQDLDRLDERYRNNTPRGFSPGSDEYRERYYQEERNKILSR